MSCCPACGQPVETAEKRRFRQSRERIEEIQRACHERMLSQREVARLIGCSQSTVSRIVSPMPW